MKPWLRRSAWLAPAFFAALAIPGGLSFGQSPADGQLFRATTKLVQVSVIARDQSGKPVADLKREEFEIFDNGSAQKIRVFAAEKGAIDTAKPRRAGAFTNRLAESKGPHSGYSIILIDGLLATFLDPGPPMVVREHGSGLERLQALKVLRSLAEGEKIAIYATGRKLEVICEFSSDRNLLEQELEKWKPNMDTPDTSKQVIEEAIHFSGGVRGMEAANKQVEDSMHKQLDAASNVDMAGRADVTEGEMEAVADHLAGIPGRKNLLWLSNRFVLGPRAIQKFNRASVSLYPIDTDGICEYCATRPIETMNAIAAATAKCSAKRLDLSVNVDVSDLGLEPQEGMWKGRAEGAVQCLAADGRPAGEAQAQTFTFNLRPVTYASMVAGGLPLQLELNIPDKAVTVKFLIGNLATGKVGTLTMPLSDVKSK